MGGGGRIQTQAKLTTATSQCISSYGGTCLYTEEIPMISLPSIFYDKKDPEALYHDSAFTVKTGSSAAVITLGR